MVFLKLVTQKRRGLGFELFTLDCSEVTLAFFVSFVEAENSH